MPPRHRFLEPIHNVKEGKIAHIGARTRQPHVFMPGNLERRPARRQSQQSCALRGPHQSSTLMGTLARYAALADLAAGAN
jgi:hypothetical protein